MPETKVCIRCGLEYEPKYYDVMGLHILRGQGNCPECCKQLLAEEEAQEKARLEQEIIQSRNNRLSASGIPALFKTKTFATFEKGWQDNVLGVCKKYAREYPLDKRPVSYPSLYLFSKNTWGVGKTHLSCAIALEILKRWDGGPRSCPNIIFVSESDLFRSIQATYSFNYDEAKTRDSEDDIIKKLVNCDLLILDDVGKEKRADQRFVQRTLFGIIDNRYKVQLPMIITANVDPDGLKYHLEGASADRVFELTEGRSICMDGKSYRRRSMRR